MWRALQPGVCGHSERDASRSFAGGFAVALSDGAREGQRQDKYRRRECFMHLSD
jgi:hypothetical protein